MTYIDRIFNMVGCRVAHVLAHFSTTLSWKGRCTRK